MECFEQELGIVDLTMSESSWISKLVDYYIEKNKGKKKFSDYEEKSLRKLQEKALRAYYKR